MMMLNALTKKRPILRRLALTVSALALALTMSAGDGFAQRYEGTDPHKSDPNKSYKGQGAGEAPTFSDWTPMQNRMSLKGGQIKAETKPGKPVTRHVLCSALPSYVGGEKAIAGPGDTIKLYPEEYKAFLKAWVNAGGIAKAPDSISTKVDEKNSARIATRRDKTEARNAASDALEEAQEANNGAEIAAAKKKLKTANEAIKAAEDTCNLTGVLVQRAVTIESAFTLDSGPKRKFSDLLLWDRVDLAMRQQNDANKMVVNCNPNLSEPSQCITVSLKAAEAATIRGFYFAQGQDFQYRPFVELTKGGLTLDQNVFHGGMAEITTRVLQTYAVLLLGNKATVSNNTFVNILDGIVFYPPEGGATKTNEPDYAITGNLFYNYSGIAVVMSGSMLPGIRTKEPPVSHRLPFAFIHNNGFINELSIPALKPTGVFVADVKAKIVANRFKSVAPSKPSKKSKKTDGFEGLPAPQGNTHIHVVNAETQIEENYFSGAGSSIAFEKEIDAFARVNRNIFENNRQIYGNVQNLIKGGSPFPSYNICRNQNLQSFGVGKKGKPQQQVYLTRPLPTKKGMKPPQFRPSDSRNEPVASIGTRNFDWWNRSSSSRAKVAFRERAKQFIGYENEFKWTTGEVKPAPSGQVYVDAYKKGFFHLDDLMRNVPNDDPDASNIVLHYIEQTGFDASSYSYRDPKVTVRPARGETKTRLRDGKYVRFKMRDGITTSSSGGNYNQEDADLAARIDPKNLRFVDQAEGWILGVDGRKRSAIVELNADENRYGAVNIYVPEAPKVNKILDNWKVRPVVLARKSRWQNLDHYYYCFNYQDVFQVR